MRAMIDCNIQKLLAFAVFIGLVVTSVGHSQSSLKTRRQIARWYAMRSIAPTRPNEQGVSMINLIGARKSELRRILKTFPPPTREEMHGEWLGLNRGFGPAMIGATQFKKEFFTLVECPHGDNITMHQFQPECWRSRAAWQPALKNGQIDRHGFYKINAPNGSRPFPQAVELNYGQADNPKWTAERFLVDKLVKVDDDHLLGYAMFQLGFVRTPGFYFVLERVRCAPCDVDVPCATTIRRTPPVI